MIYFVEVFKDTYKMIDCLPAMILTYGAFVMYHNSVIHFKTVLKNFIFFFYIPIEWDKRYMIWIV